MKRWIVILMLFVMIVSLSACSDYIYSNGDYSDHICSYSGCDNIATIMIRSKTTRFEEYYCSEHSSFAQSLYTSLTEYESQKSGGSKSLGVFIGAIIVMILTFLYTIFLAMHTKNISELLVKVVIFFVVTLIVVSILGMMLTSGHILFGLMMLALIFVAIVSLS